MMEKERPGAIARMVGAEAAPCLRGTVKFYPRGAGVLVVADIRGLPENGTGFYALHIHEGGSCGGADFADTQGHYDPKGRPHPNHAGDLPPLLACGGRTFLAVCTQRFCLPQVLGRTVVIHSGPDDFHTQPAGNARQKIACGVIRRC